MNYELPGRPDIQTEVFGTVPESIVKEALETVIEVLNEMNYVGTPPRVLITDTAAVLASGEEASAFYRFNGAGHGLIRLGVERILKMTRGTAPDSVKVALWAAHEAVEHVNHMRGKELLLVTSVISPEIHAKAKSEQEANEIAKAVLRKRYKVDATFDEEKYY
ncbi:MAG: hypothetical protein Q7S31_03280 [bacterium]|nr:hypothetical protein [bacterium]